MISILTAYNRANIDNNSHEVQRNYQYTDNLHENNQSQIKALQAKVSQLEIQVDILTATGLFDKGK